MTTAESELPRDEDELELEALALRRRRKLPMLTVVLTLAVVAGGAFVGGVEAQKNLGSTGSSTGSNNGSALAARFGKGFSRGAGVGPATTGQFTAGTVTAIKGSTLYVTDASGNILKVSTSAGSQVTKTVTGKVTDIRPGDSVVVRGTKGKNGTIAAASITLGGGGAGSFFAGRGAANGGATGFGANGATK